MIDEQELAKDGFQYRAAYLNDRLSDHPDDEMSEEAVMDEITNMKALYDTVNEPEDWYDEQTLDQLAASLDEQYEIDLHAELEIDDTPAYGFEIDISLFSVIDRAESFHSSLQTIYRKYLGHGQGSMGDAVYRMPKE